MENNQTRLTDTTKDSGHSVFSPDGKKIAFESFREGNVEIYVMEASGNNPTRLTINAAKDSAPAWSVDGKQIAFASDRDSHSEIYTMNADGSNQTKVIANNFTSSNSQPSWH